jgi:signal transduction histidine kinase
MRERVRVHGGSLQAGAAEGGGFDVHAVLPVRAE